MIGTAVDNW